LIEKRTPEKPKRLRANLDSNSRERPLGEICEGEEWNGGNNGALITFSAKRGS